MSVVVLAAVLSGAAPASAAVTCSYDPAERIVAVELGPDNATISVVDETAHEIQLTGGNVTDCGDATTANTDLVTVHGSNRDGDGQQTFTIRNNETGSAFPASVSFSVNLGRSTTLGSSVDYLAVVGTNGADHFSMSGDYEGHEGAQGRIDTDGSTINFAEVEYFSFSLGDGADRFDASEVGYVPISTQPKVTVKGEAGDDVIIGSNVEDNLDGGDGDDELRAKRSYDLLDGGGGSDILSGGGHRDEVLYLDRTSDLTVSLDGVANDGEGDEGDNVKPDVESVTGGAGSDTLIGSDDPNYLYGSGGEDRLIGGGDRDVLRGVDGDDVLIGKAGADWLEGAENTRDTEDEDVLRGGVGDDRLTGGAGIDVLVGGPGSDWGVWLTLDRHIEELEIDLRSGTAIVPEGTEDFEGLENVFVWPGPTAATIWGTDSDNRIVTSSGADEVHAGGGDDRIVTGEGADLVEGGGGGDSILGRAGDDLLVGGNGIDAANGGLHIDVCESETVVNCEP